MKSVSRILSSAAKFEVLGLLCQRSASLPLRHIAYLTDLPIRSVELAVASLCAQKVIRKRRSGRQVLLSINENHASHPVLRDIFALVSKSVLPPPPDMDKKAKAVLAFVDSAGTFFRSVKR